MFIRKRLKKLKNEEWSVTYQVVKSYRENGKVRQEVISLGKSSDIKEVLNEELRFLARMRKDLDFPISEYKEVRLKRGFGLMVVYLPEKISVKRRKSLEKKYQKQRKRIAVLESLASEPK